MDGEAPELTTTEWPFSNDPRTVAAQGRLYTLGHRAIHASPSRGEPQHTAERASEATVTAQRTDPLVSPACIVPEIEANAAIQSRWHCHNSGHPVIAPVEQCTKTALDSEHSDKQDAKSGAEDAIPASRVQPTSYRAPVPPDSVVRADVNITVAPRPRLRWYYHNKGHRVMPPRTTDNSQQEGRPTGPGQSEDYA